MRVGAIRQPPLGFVSARRFEDRLALLARANGSRAASFQRAFRVGSTCYVALADGAIAGYSWVNREIIDIPGLLTMKLPEEGAYNYNSFVFPEYRGCKVFQCLIARVAADMKTEGKAFVANTVNADNAPSVAARQHTGTKFRRCRILKPRFLPPLFLGRALRPGDLASPGHDDLR